MSQVEAKKPRSLPCVKCGERPKKRAGGLCNTCWRREGRPEGGGEGRGKGELEGASLPTQLRYMRKAWEWRGAKTNSPRLQFCLALKESNPKEFFVQLERLEKEYRAMKAGKAPGETQPAGQDACDADEGGAQILAMIDRLLKLGSEAASK